MSRLDADQARPGAGLSSAPSLRPIATDTLPKRKIIEKPRLLCGASARGKTDRGTQPPGRRRSIPRPANAAPSKVKLAGSGMS
jgi:hypothetical protein